jgi:hypothetical protein
MFARRTFVPVLALSLLASCSKPPNPPSTSSPASSVKSAESPSAAPVHAISSKANPGQSETEVVMHSVILNERPGLQLRVRWLRGQVHPTRTGVVPSFDEPSSFILNIQSGVIATSLSDISGILNQGLLKGSPLGNVSLVSN